MEQLPVEHDVGVPPASADRGVRRRHPGVQRGILKSAQGSRVNWVAVDYDNHRLVYLPTYNRIPDAIIAQTAILFYYSLRSQINSNIFL